MSPLNTNQTNINEKFIILFLSHSPPHIIFSHIKLHKKKLGFLAHFISIVCNSITKNLKEMQLPILIKSPYLLERNFMYACTYVRKEREKLLCNFNATKESERRKRTMYCK